MADYTTWLETPPERVCFSLRTDSNLVQISAMSNAVMQSYIDHFGHSPESDDAIRVDARDKEIIFSFEKPTSTSFSSIFGNGRNINV